MPLQPRNQVYQVYRYIGDQALEWALVPGATLNYELLQHAVNGEPMTLIAEFTETSWKRAKQAYEDIMASVGES